MATNRMMVAEDGAPTERSVPLIEGVPPLQPGEHITGAWATAYLAAVDPTIKERFDKMSALSRITIPNTDVALRTAQLELFMSAL